MKRLLLLMLLAIPSLAQIALQAHGTQFCTTPGCTTADLSLNTTGATMLWITLNSAGGVDPNGATLTDSKANTWHKLTSSINSVSTTQWYAYASASDTAPLVVGTGHLFHATMPPSPPALTAFGVVAWKGIVTFPSDPFDNQPAPTNTASATSLATGSILCSQSNSLIMTSVAYRTAWTTAYAVDSGFTILDTLNFITVQRAGLGDAYLVQSGSPSAVNPTWSGAPAGNIATTIACFKGASTSTSAPRHRVTQ